MHDPSNSLSFIGPSRRGLILVALSALGFALTALLILLPNRPTFAAAVDVGVTQTSSTNSPVVGALLTYTVVVTNGPTPTDGPVLFTDTLPANVTLASVSTTQGTCIPGAPVTCTIAPTMTANSAVTVTLAVTPTAAGPASNQAIIAVTGADTDTFAGNDTTTLPLTVGPGASTTTITSDTPDPSVVGQLVTVNFSVAGAGMTPTSQVTITVSGGPETCTGTLTAGAGSCSLTLTSAGARTLTASYGGDANYLASSDTEPHTVNPANTTTTLITSGTPSVFGQAVTFTATVAAQAPGSGTPSGTVTFFVNGASVATTALNGSGQATYLTSTLPVATHTITATYAGSSNFNSSTSGTLNQTVNPANTNTFITSAVPSQPTLGQTLTVSYSVSVVPPGAGSPAGNVTVSAGSDTCTATVAAGGCTLTFRDPPGTGTRTLTAVYAGNGNFNGSTSAAISITVTLPTVRFSAATYNVQEDTGGSSPAPVTATITATLSNPSIYTVTVNYATSNGSAVAGSDYLTATGVLTFTPGQTQRSFNVTTNPDGFAEDAETIALTLSSPTANRAALGAPNPATLIIVDNEGVPKLQFSQSAATVNEAAGSLGVLVTLSIPAQNPVTVRVTSVNGTAVAGQDFDAVDHTLTFAPSTTAQSFNVTIRHDNIYETDEVFTLTLSGVPDENINPFLNTQTVTVQSNDTPPSVHFGFPTYAFAEGDGAVTIAVTLSRPSALPVQVNYATSNGTALAGVDYQPVSGTLTFAPLITRETFPVTLLDDTLAEDYKNLYLTLSNPVVATASGAGMNATLTIANDDARAGCTIFPSSDVPKIIPDNSPAGVESQIVLPGPGFVITDVSVRINSLQHAYLGDLVISLVAPDGRSVSLLNNIGPAPNLIYTVFNDAGQSIIGFQPPFTGVFRPNTPLPALRRLNGSLSGGVWRLHIVDMFSPDSGVLSSWGLELCGTITMTHVVYLPLVRR